MTALLRRTMSGVAGLLGAGLGRLGATASLLGATALLLGATLGLLACDPREGADGRPSGQVAAPVFTVLAGSEVRDLESTLVQAAQAAGVTLELSYAGTLDIVDRVNAGEVFDAILPASGAYPSLALQRKPLAREKLFYSRVALGVVPAKMRELGWDRNTPSWAQIARAAGDGRLSFAMTNPASSNSGMSALFAVASAVAGKTEDLAASEVDARVLTDFMRGQKLTAGSSGWLAEAYVKNPGVLDAMVNYESVILRANAKLPDSARLIPLYPRDGVISADHPLMLLNEGRRADYDKLVSAFKAPALQAQVAREAFLRPSLPGTPVASALSAAPVAELAFPNRLEVMDAVLASYLAQWRRPATSIFVLDTSGSMKGQRIDDMRAALKVLAGAEPSGSASERYAAFQSRERVLLLTFSDRVAEPLQVTFEPTTMAAARQQVLNHANALQAAGGTAIYAALLRAQSLAREERRRDPGRYVSIVLLSDGENTAGPDFAAFRKAQTVAAAVRVFPVIFGEAPGEEMVELANLTGGRPFDARKASLALVFKEIRGYQ